ncbi:NAD-P-binding protein [Cubamyces sp. BRFM 1775]|nr:NAD-P-binding protein [Cubamyces sp. BRFM 1775]
MSSTEAPQPSRVAIVTGAAQGLGEAIALRLADGGFDIAIADLPVKRDQVEAVVRAIEAKGRRALGVYGDVSCEADVVALVERTVQELGGLDVMVANAGIYRSTPILELTVEEYDTMMAVNARGVMLALKHAGRQMVKQGRGGRILAAASWAAKQGILNAPAYSASKFATRGLVQSAALELRQYNITVNAYAPGLILTPLTLHPDDEVNGGPGSTAMKHAGLPNNIKAGTPEEVAELVAYLVKPEARFVTGQCININGGLGMD